MGANCHTTIDSFVHNRWVRELKVETQSYKV